MIKVKLSIIWQPYPDKEKEDIVYVDSVYDRKVICGFLRKFYENDIPDDVLLEKCIILGIEFLGAVLLCDICGEEKERLNSVYLGSEYYDYSVCERCLEEIRNNVALIKKENLKWKTNILGNK
jgi:hypothetical protein